MILHRPTISGSHYFLPFSSSSKSRLIIISFFSLLVLISSSCFIFSFALRVFLIDPNNFDPTTKIINSSAWSSSQQDYSTDSDGGILIFDGAIAENTRLEIRNLKARRIEVNATLSRGSTLLIENNQLIYGTSAANNSQINQRFGEIAGGIVVAPTIFRSSDGQYACSKITSWPSSNNNNIIQIIISNNYVTTFGKTMQIDSRGVRNKSPDAEAVNSAILVYFLSACDNPNNNNNNNYNINSSASPFAYASIVVTKNIVDINCETNCNPSVTISIFPWSRINNFASIFSSSPSVSVISPPTRYQLNIPISNLQITHNNVTADAVHVQIGPKEADKCVMFYISNVSGETTIFEVALNTFELNSTESSVAVVQMAALPKSSSSPNSNSIVNNPAKLIFNFHDQHRVRVRGICRIVVVDLIFDESSAIVFEANYYNNNDVLIYQLEPSGSCSGLALAAGIAVICRGDENKIAVSNSTFQFSLVSTFVTQVNFPKSTRIGTIAIDSLVMEMLPLKFPKPKNSSALEATRRQYSFLYFDSWSFVGKVTAQNNTYSESKLDFGRDSWWKKSSDHLLFNFNSFNQTSPLTRKGINVLTVRMSHVVVLNSLWASLICMASSTPVIDNILVEENFMNVSGSKIYLMFISYEPNKYLTVYSHAEFLRNTVVATCENCSSSTEISAVLSCRSLSLNASSSRHTSLSSPSSSPQLAEKQLSPLGVPDMVVEGNTFFSEGFETAYFFSGVWMASGDDIESSHILLRNNFVSMIANETAVFFVFNPPANATPAFQWNMKRITLDGNNISVVCRAIAGFVGAGYGDRFNPSLYFEIGAQFLIRSNRVNISASAFSYQLSIQSVLVSKLLFSNNIFWSSTNPAPAVPFDGVPLYVMEQVKIIRFSIFSASTIDTVDLSYVDASSSASPPICSTFNGRSLTTEWFRTLVIERVSNPVALLMAGSAVPSFIHDIQSQCRGSDTNSESFSQDLTASPTRTVPKMQLPPQTKTKTFVLPRGRNPFIEKISQPVASALVASDATQAIAVVSVAVLGSISSSPVLGFNVGRQQAMTNFAKKSLEGDCRGLLPATTVNDFEEHVSNPLGLGDSPTQMSIGGSEKLMSYYVGAVVGDFILTFGLVLLSQGIGMAVMKYFESKKNIKSNFGRMVRDRMGNKHRNNKINESTLEMTRRVFATSYVSLTLFFCLSFLLTPILSSSLIVLVAAMNDPKLKDHEVAVGLKILCVILAVIFCAVAVYFVVWSVFVRKQRKEKYRMLKQETEPSFATKFFKAEGEWCYPNPTSIEQQNLVNLMNRSKKNKNSNNQFICWYHNFLISEPTFESYRDSIWFCSIEIISAILLAFPPFFAQFSSSGKGSCLVQGVMLLLILLIYTILLIWKNPFKLRILRIMNPILALQQLVVVLMSLIIAATRGDSDDSESPSWLWKVIIIPLGFQGAMSFLMIGAAFFPGVMFLKKLRGRITRSTSDRTPRRTNHEMNLLPDRSRNNHRDRSNQRRPSERNHYQDHKRSQNSSSQNNSKRSQQNRERRLQQEEYSNNRQNPRINYDDRHSRNRLSSQHDRHPVDSFSSRQLASPKSSDHYRNGNRDISPSSNTRPSSPPQRDAHFSSSSDQNESRKDLPLSSRPPSSAISHHIKRSEVRSNKKIEHDSLL